MSDNRELRDLTDFLLEWRDTCAIDLCPHFLSRTNKNGEAIPVFDSNGNKTYICAYKNPGESDSDYAARIQGDVAFVHHLADRRFKFLVEHTRAPDKVGLAKKREEEAKNKEDKDRLENLSSDDEFRETDDLSELEKSPEKQGNDADSEQEDAPSPTYDVRPVERDSSSGRSVGSALADESNVSQDKLDSNKDPGPAPIHGSRQNLRGQMVSEYLDIVQSWKPGEKRRTHAFTILEGYLYNKETINGVPFKNYLFNVVASRDGIGGVWGYLFKGIIPTMVKTSFRTVTVADENLTDRNPTGMNPTDVWISTHVGAYQAGTDEAADCLFKWVSDHWPKFDVNDKLALMCTIFEVSMNDSRVTAMTTVGRQAFYNRKVLARKSLEFLLESGFEQDEVQKLLGGTYHAILLRIAGKDTSCRPFLDFLANTASEPGK